MRYIRQMPKDPKKRRFEVHFLPDKSRDFEKEAKKDGRSLKNLMEKVLLDWLEQQKVKK